MKPIHAIYENGVFRPTEPVDLPEHTEVKVEPTTSKRGAKKGRQLPSAVLPEILKQHPQYRTLEILSHRYDTGESDLAARIDEHQP
jgi:predicted DNA-binding antitoxin AbrB/MazE fold protein